MPSTGTDELLVVTNRHRYRVRAVLLAHRPALHDYTPPIPVPDLPTITVDAGPDDPDGRDVLVVGYTDHAVELAATIAAAGGNVVLAAGGMDPDLLSPAADNALGVWSVNVGSRSFTGRSPTRSTSSTATRWPISTTGGRRTSSSITSFSHRIDAP